MLGFLEACFASCSFFSAEPHQKDQAEYCQDEDDSGDDRQEQIGCSRVRFELDVAKIELAASGNFEGKNGGVRSRPPPIPRLVNAASPPARNCASTERASVRGS